MSRAFVSEDAAAASAAELPERPISPGPNPVTPAGLAQMDAALERLQRLRDSMAQDDPDRPATDRDLRYWRARRLSAQLVPAADADPEQVVFGAAVTVRRPATPDKSYVLVGEDEADPALGLLSWSSPLAQALMGARAGDDIELGPGRPGFSVVAVKRGAAKEDVLF